MQNKFARTDLAAEAVGNDARTQALAGGVDGGGEAGGAGPEDDELAVFGFHGKKLRWTCAFGAQAA